MIGGGDLKSGSNNNYAYKNPKLLDDVEKIEEVDEDCEDMDS